MNIKLHILNEGGRLAHYSPVITSGFEIGVKDVREKLAITGVDVVVADNPASAIPETGVGGFAPTGHIVYINIDPNFIGLEQVLEAEIKSTLAHELHHCARFQSVGYGKTLLEALVSEGLADHFDMEINGGAPKPWSIAVQGEELRQLTERAKQEFTNKKYHHDQWFFGSEKESIPRWAGYSIGFHIIGEYISKTGKQSSTLVSVTATDVVSRIFVNN